MIKEELIRSRMMCDSRGKISTGMKSPKGYPMSTDYFVCDAFKEITGLYGEKPKKLIIYMPSDDLYDFFDCNFQQYRSDHQKVRQCDGEMCRHILDETVNIKPKEGETELRSKSFEQGQVTACICNYMPETVVNKKNETVKNPQLCSYGMSLKAFVANPVTMRPMSPQPIMFRSGSKNTGDTIFTELKRYTRFRGIPFEVEVDLVRVGGKQFPVWKIRPYIDFESMVSYQLENAPVDTGLRALPPPMAPVEDGQFDNNGAYTDGGMEIMGKNEKMKEILSGKVGGVLNETTTADKSASQSGNVQDAEFTEIVPDKGTDENGVEILKDGGLIGRVGEIQLQIIKCSDVKKLNEYWISISDEVKEMGIKERRVLMEFRDKKKAKMKGVELASEKNKDDLPF